MEDVKYGRVEREETLDVNGSTKTVSAVVHDGNPTDVKTRYEVRVRVHNEKEELTEYLKFRNETRAMTKAEFRIEHTAIGNKGGFYYVVKCWTVHGAE